MWFNADPGGIIIAGLAWILLFGANFSMCYSFLHVWSGMKYTTTLLNIFISNTFCMICLYTHWKVMTTDPGVVPKDAIPPQPQPQPQNRIENTDSSEDVVSRRLLNSHLQCGICESFKPSRSSHCTTCQRCISLMDHHCPWVNNCVGIGNQKLFLLLIFYVFLYCCYVLLVIYYQYFTCSGSHRCGFQKGKIPGWLAMITAALAWMFFLFGIIMGSLQLFSIYLDVPFSEDGTKLRNATKWKKLELKVAFVFGTSEFSWTWLLPSKIDLSKIDTETDLGFTVSFGGSDDIAV